MVASLVVVKVLASNASNTLVKIEKDIEIKKAEFTSNESEEVVNFQNELTNLKTIMRDHISFSNALNNISLNTHQQVKFTSLKINYEDKLIEINGVAPSNEVVAQASNIFSNLENVKQVNFKNIKAFSDGMHFVMTLNVLESFFK